MNAALKPDFARTHAFLAQKHGLLINNEWVQPRGGGRIEVLNPATGKLLGYAAAGGAEDIDLAVRAARQAFENGPWPDDATGGARQAAVETGRPHRAGRR